MNVAKAEKKEKMWHGETLNHKKGQSATKIWRIKNVQNSIKRRIY
nr:MAG TPA: hypothetical protein [Bacteriophage sp.]